MRLHSRDTCQVPKALEAWRTTCKDCCRPGACENKHAQRCVRVHRPALFWEPFHLDNLDIACTHACILHVTSPAGKESEGHKQRLLDHLRHLQARRTA